MTKEKSQEGYCGQCENFGQLHEVDGKLICAECMEEQGLKAHEDD
jgi:hypothetical protein